MKKPQGWDSSTAFTGEFKSIAPGGHICRIVQAQADTTKTGKEVLVILFDIAEGEAKDFYREQHEERKKANADAKWAGVYRQLTEGNSIPFYKGMTTAIENSNPGYKWDFDEKTLKGKLFGGVFGQEEYYGQDGSIKLATKLMQIRSVDQVKKGVKTPEIKRLQPGSGFAATNGTPQLGFDDEDIPF